MKRYIFPNFLCTFLGKSRKFLPLKKSYCRKIWLLRSQAPQTLRCVRVPQTTRTGLVPFAAHTCFTFMSSMNIYSPRDTTANPSGRFFSSRALFFLRQASPFLMPWMQALSLARQASHVPPVQQPVDLPLGIDGATLFSYDLSYLGDGPSAL